MRYIINNVTHIINYYAPHRQLAGAAKHHLIFFLEVVYLWRLGQANFFGFTDSLFALYRYLSRTHVPDYLLLPAHACYIIGLCRRPSDHGCQC